MYVYVYLGVIVTETMPPENRTDENREAKKRFNA